MRVISKINIEVRVALKAGKTIVFPTETSYGLGCDAANEEAVDKIFAIKGRPKHKPLLVIVPSVDVARQYLVWNELLEKIANKYWPGLLTVVGKYPPPLFKEGDGGGQSALGGRENRVIGFNRTLGFRQQLRRDQTKAEKVLWSNLKGKKLGGFKFRRQHGIGPFIVDFYQPNAKVVIELDGDIHFVTDINMRRDAERTEWLKKRGYEVIRFNNVEIFSNLEWVLEHIHHVLTSPRPSLKRGGCDGLADGAVSADGTLAVRVTAHPVAAKLAELLGRPLVATSANPSGAGELYSAREVMEAFSKQKLQPDMVLDYGELPRRQPTTVVSIVDGEIKVLREGEIKCKI